MKPSITIISHESQVSHQVILLQILHFAFVSICFAFCYFVVKKNVSRKVLVEGFCSKGEDTLYMIGHELLFARRATHRYRL